MNKIDELIQQYCPDGVEYAKLGDCIKSLNTGLNPRQFFKLNTEDATNYYITIREIQNNTIVVNDKTDRLNDEALRLCNNRSNLEKGDVLFSGTGTIGEVAVIEDTPTNWNIKEGVYAIKPDPSIINYKFLMYLLQSTTIRKDYLKKAEGGTVKSVSMGEMRKLKIPLPPLPVQEAIVYILDRFAEYTAELQAELQARQQQYNYYRDTLLSFEGREDVQWKKLGEVADLGTGSHNTQDGLVEGKYPFYTRGSEILYLNDYDYDETAIITAGDGAGVGKVFHFVQGKYALHQRAYRIVPNEKIVLAKFVYYYIGATFYKYIMKSSVSSSVVSIRKPMMVDYPIPVPSVKEQERVISILDNFYSLINDLSQGLPAEIEARQQQYEYYRDQLLTFKRM